MLHGEKLKIKIHKFCPCYKYKRTFFNYDNLAMHIWIGNFHSRGFNGKVFLRNTQIKLMKLSFQKKSVFKEFLLQSEQIL